MLMMVFVSCKTVACNKPGNDSWCNHSMQLANRTFPAHWFSFTRITEWFTQGKSTGYEGSLFRDIPELGIQGSVTTLEGEGLGHTRNISCLISQGIVWTQLCYKERQCAIFPAFLWQESKSRGYCVVLWRMIQAESLLSVIEPQRYFGGSVLLWLSLALLQEDTMRDECAFCCSTIDGWLLPCCCCSVVPLMCCVSLSQANRSL